MQTDISRAPTLVGRRSSLFTRVPLFFSVALGLDFDFEVIPDMTRLSTEAYGGHPALKLPVLRIAGTTVYGAQNICRVLVEHVAAQGGTARVVWPEELPDILVRNAHELVAHCMTAQVQQVMGVQVAGLPPDNVFFEKNRSGLGNSLRWLDANLDAVLAALPRARHFSYLEVCLFCLLEHLRFRATVEWAGLPRLAAFAQDFARHPAALATEYRFDAQSHFS